MEGASAIGLNLSRDTVIPRPIRWSKNPNVGIVFRSCYLEHKRSAFLYELEKRISGKYRFRKPWIYLDEEHRSQLWQLWPDRPRAGIAQYSLSHFPAMPGWTTPVVASWNLRLND